MEFTNVEKRKTKLDTAGNIPTLSTQMSIEENIVYLWKLLESGGTFLQIYDSLDEITAPYENQVVYIKFEKYGKSGLNAFKYIGGVWTLTISDLLELVKGADGALKPIWLTDKYADITDFSQRGANYEVVMYNINKDGFNNSEGFVLLVKVGSEIKEIRTYEELIKLFNELQLRVEKNEIDIKQLKKDVGYVENIWTGNVQADTFQLHSITGTFGKFDLSHGEPVYLTFTIDGLDMNATVGVDILHQIVPVELANKDIDVSFSVQTNNLGHILLTRFISKGATSKNKQDVKLVQVGQPLRSQIPDGWESKDIVLNEPAIFSLTKDIPADGSVKYGANGEPIIIDRKNIISVKVNATMEKYDGTDSYTGEIIGVIDTSGDNSPSITFKNPLNEISSGSIYVNSLSGSVNWDQNRAQNSVIHSIEMHYLKPTTETILVKKPASGNP